MFLIVATLGVIVLIPIFLLWNRHRRKERISIMNEHEKQQEEQRRQEAERQGKTVSESQRAADSRKQEEQRREDERQREDSQRQESQRREDSRRQEDERRRQEQRQQTEQKRQESQRSEGEKSQEAAPPEQERTREERATAPAPTKTETEMQKQLYDRPDLKEMQKIHEADRKQGALPSYVFQGMSAEPDEKKTVPAEPGKAQPKESPAVEKLKAKMEQVKKTVQDRGQAKTHDTGHDR